LLLLWLFLISISLTRWTLMTTASQGRLLFPALPTIALVLALGWAEWMPRRLGHRRDGLPLIGATGLLLLAAVLPGWLIRPVYAAPELLNP